MLYLHHRLELLHSSSRWTVILTLSLTRYRVFLRFSFLLKIIKNSVFLLENNPKIGVFLGVLVLNLGFLGTLAPGYEQQFRGITKRPSLPFFSFIKSIPDKSHDALALLSVFFAKGLYYPRKLYGSLKLTHMAHMTNSIRDWLPVQYTIKIKDLSYTLNVPIEPPRTSFSPL